MPAARRTVILAVLLVAAGSLIFTTGAAVIDGDADTGVDDDLAIQPADGPNGDYAYLNDDDEIVVDVSPANPNLDSDFEGVNVGATGTIDDVFTITYTGEEIAHVWIEHEGDAVTFVADGEPIESNASNVTLAPNESVAVGLDLDTRDAEAGARLSPEEFEINTRLAEPEGSGDDGLTDDGATNGGSTTNDESATSETESTTDDTDGAALTVTAPGANERGLEASGIREGDAARFDTEGMAVAGDAVTLHRIDLEGVSAESVSMAAEGDADPFPDAGPLEAETEPRPLGYLALDYDFDPEAVEEMGLRFSVDPEALGDADPADVVVYRQTDDGEWVTRDTAVVGDAAVRVSGLSTDRVHSTAHTEDFSTFAIAVEVPRVGVTTASAVDETVASGAETVVEASAENDGGADGEETVTLTANGESVASETVSLDPGETTTVSFPVAFDEPGEYDLAVDGAPAGTLVVESDGPGDDASGDDGASGDDESTDEAPGDDETGPAEEPSAFGLAGIGGVGALLVVVLAAIAVARRAS